jgi:hypothetical protein
MKPVQNLSNHSRLHPTYHFFIAPLAIGGLVASGWTLFFVTGSIWQHVLQFILSLTITSTAALLRVYALKVQDRVIRSEENFRHFRLTGSVLNQNLRMSQIIALRFASDEEFPALAARALNEKLTAKQIKEAIVSWKADYWRI